MKPVPAPLKASWWQVARTMFWGLFMVGRRTTMEEDGARMTFAQVVTGAVAALCVVLALLGLLVYGATH